MTGAAGDEPSEPADVAEAEDRDEDDDEEPRPQIEVHAFRHLIDAQNNKREWRKFPSMVRLAIRLVWSASASRATFTTVVSLVTSLGVGVQLLFGNSLLGRALVLRAAGGDLVTLAPRAIAFAVLSVSLALLTAASDVQSKVLGDMVGARTYDHVLDTAGAVGLTRFEDSKFYDDLQKATFGAQFQPSSIVSSLVSLLSAVVGAASISVALVSLQPALLGLVLLGAIPVWIAARRNAQTQIRVFGEETPEARERGYLRSVLTDRIAAKEIRAFGLVRPLRVRHDVLTMSILTRSRKSAFEQARRRLLAQGAGGVTSGLAGALLLALLVDGRIAVAAAVTATLAVQQVRGRVTGGASAVGTMYSSALFLESYADFMSIRPSETSRRRTRCRLRRSSDSLRKR